MAKKKAGRICPVCKEDQLNAKSCSREARRGLGRLIAAGVEHEPIPFKPASDGDRCSDCGAAEGLHHFGCTREKCPACGGQFISCGCWDETFDHLA
jgi:hypothetical protein